MSSANSFRNEHDGALCFKIASGCCMRSLAICSLWKDMPSPVFCEHLAELSTFEDANICFVTVLVHKCNDETHPSEKPSESLTVTLRDQRSHARQCTVFPPPCHSALWQVGIVLDIFGCIFGAQYESLRLSSDACIGKAENHSPASLGFGSYPFSKV